MSDQNHPRPLTEVLATPFADWWEGYIEQVAAEIDHKAKVYGSNSLEQIGRLIPRARGDQNLDQSAALEMGCFVYAYGKMERVADAILRGELPGEDSWHDLMVYAAMALYIREVGTWP